MERENINDIVREIKFGQSEWTAKNPDALAGGELQAVKYIVAGNLEFNSEALRNDPDTPDNWTGTVGFPEDTHKKDPYIFRLRLYSTRTCVVTAVGDGYGATPSEAMTDAVQTLASETIRRHKLSHK